MAKSNMQAVRRRAARTYRQNFDKQQQIEVRAFKQRRIERERARSPEIQATVRWYRRITRRFTAFLGRLFRPGSPGIGRLDLRSGKLERFALFNTANRDGGATYLRSLWPGLGTTRTRRKIKVSSRRHIWKRGGMVSTRDGRPV